MSKAGQLRRTVNKEIQRQLRTKGEKTRLETRSLGKRIVGFLVTVLGLPGILVAVLQILPRVTVSAQDPLDQHNPFLAPFVTSNEGYVTLKKLQALCFPVNVELIGIDGKGGSIVIEPSPGYREEDMDTGMTSTAFVADKLPPGSKMTFPCQMVLPSDFATNLAVGHAEITFIVTYHVIGIPWIKRHHVNHFSLSRDVSGHAHWLEEPLVN